MSRADTPSLRKGRGAFFTPEGITQHLAAWAVRDASDRVLEPSTGEAAFLVAAVDRLKELGAIEPEVHGVEVHGESAGIARALINQLGARAVIRVSDFFKTAAQAKYDVVIGNPPFIRYQDWTGAQRDRARLAALHQGVALTGLASSWAAFVVHAAGQLRRGGRLAMVLPAELLSVNYAAPVRRFLLEQFRSVELIVFDEQVFPDAEADTVLVKADGWREGPTGEARLRQARNATTLRDLGAGTSWIPTTTDARWQPLPLRDVTTDALASVLKQGHFAPLIALGETSLGAVTGGNRFFALTPQRVAQLQIPRRDLIRISPPGSAHLRRLDLTSSRLTALGKAGEPTWLLWPSESPAQATQRYIEEGEHTGVKDAYKCRVRRPWYRTPLLAPPDLFVTYMNADAPRLVGNSAGTRHLNSVHGVYLRDDVRALAREVLPVASLNSITLLSGELTGRSYGGGVLKIEPREADRWWVPSEALLRARRGDLVAIKAQVDSLLKQRRLLDAASLVDEVLLADCVDSNQLVAVRADHADWMARRVTRGKSG